MSTRIERAVERLEDNLPLRRKQQALPAALRRLHRSILRHFFEHGDAPTPADLDGDGECAPMLARLAAEKVILVDGPGAITGAYPFVDRPRGFRVRSRYGAVEAMCAFDALAVSDLFAEPVRIEARCRISGAAIAIDQQGAVIRLVAPAAPVFAAIDWAARDTARSCADSLCREMSFIAGAARADGWVTAAPADRELFSLQEAHELICTIFLPLMRAR